MLVAIENAKVIGMVAYHRHSDERCEMKRLVERCFDLSKEGFSYRCKGWEFVPDQV